MWTLIVATSLIIAGFNSEAECMAVRDKLSYMTYKTCVYLPPKAQIILKDSK